MPAWLCFSCKDGQHANDGTPIEDCVSLFVNPPKVGANCTGSQYMNKLIKRIKKAAPDKAVVILNGNINRKLTQPIKVVRFLIF